MDQQFYPFTSGSRQFRYEFESIGQNQTIRKVVLIDESNESNIFYLALLDNLEDGTLSDSQISNNGDLRMVLATVFKIVEAFFQECPDATIGFQGSSPSRQRLYRIVLSKELSKLTEHYEINGGFEDCVETFESNKNYECYFIRKHGKRRRN